MAKPKCVKCDSTTFEHKLTKVDDEIYNFIQCSTCGAVVGVIERESTNEWLKAIYLRLDDLTSRNKLD